MTNFLKNQRPAFNYNPQELKRELIENYICSSPEERGQMLQALGLSTLDELYQHIPQGVKFSTAPDFGNSLPYEELADHLFAISQKNNLATSFLGSGLPQYQQMEIVDYVCGLRGLTTAYTPYQPERSQGTLMGLMIYQSVLSELTGFEAINASLYDRSTALFEALQTALRLHKQKGTKVVLAQTIFPGDLEVIQTMAMETNLEILLVPYEAKDGKTDLHILRDILQNNQTKIAAVAFPQVGQFGILEDVDQLTDLCQEFEVSSIGIIDPMLLGPQGLRPPAHWGKLQQGCTMIVGEGQQLALKPNFGGPGLGIFGIRFHEQNKNAIRSTAGRFVGRAKDKQGQEALCMVLSTREQHIRREKATSNICSNQSFVATIAGASLLQRGPQGIEKTIQTARENITHFFKKITGQTSLQFLFENPCSFNEVALKLPTTISAQELIEKGRKNNLHIGVDLTNRLAQKTPSLLVFFSDIHTKADIDKLADFFIRELPGNERLELKKIDRFQMRDKAPNFKGFPLEELKRFYTKLSNQNVSPDDGVYPLGSCTMKYNPYINDWAASLKGFTETHPEAPLKDVQGCLEIIYETQKIFTQITGLKGLTTQPVAGAQGELVGLKMFQAYHRLRGEDKQRKILLIPRSAHGTNPATATVAGFENKVINGEEYGLITIEALPNGEMDFDQVKQLISKYSTRIAGVMVTNPNTAGIFETKFREMSDLIHQVGGLVYMDGANMNAIASWIDLGALGVDAVHNNQHKTWTIPHGGGGPGDAIVAVSEKLLDFLPGYQVRKNSDGSFELYRPKHTMGSVHRHFGNFAHKVRAYAYVKRLGSEGVRQMSANAVLAARYLHQRLKKTYPTLPHNESSSPRMHEFILTLKDEDFKNLETKGTPKAQAMARIGKLFLDFGLHAPTVAFPEVFGLMVEPTESFTKGELDHFAQVVETIYKLIKENPEVLLTSPHFTPVDKVDEVSANTQLNFRISLNELPRVLENRIPPTELLHLAPGDVAQKIIQAHVQS